MIGLIGKGASELVSLDASTLSTKTEDEQQTSISEAMVKELEKEWNTLFGEVSTAVCYLPITTRTQVQVEWNDMEDSIVIYRQPAR
jgi:hypothetical protein